MAPTFWAAATEIAGQGVIYSSGGWGGTQQFFWLIIFHLCLANVIYMCTIWTKMSNQLSKSRYSIMNSFGVFPDCSYWMVVSECCIIHQFGHPCFKIVLFFRVLLKVRRKTTDQGWDDAGCTTGSIVNTWPEPHTECEASPFPMRLGRTGSGGIGLISLLTLNSITIAAAWING